MATKAKVRKQSIVKSKKLAAKLVLQAPQGWEVKWAVGYHAGDYLSTKWPNGEPMDDGVAVTFGGTFEGVRVLIAFNLRDVDRNSAYDRKRAVDGVTCEAHTVYDGRCFTRRGIDCESCSLVPKPEYDHQYATLAALLEGEKARCLAAAARSKTMVPARMQGLRKGGAR